jgi:hypothetical protein
MVKLPLDLTFSRVSAWPTVAAKAKAKLATVRKEKLMSAPTKMSANASLEMGLGQEWKNPFYLLGFALETGV